MIDPIKLAAAVNEARNDVKAAVRKNIHAVAVKAIKDATNPASLTDRLFGITALEGLAQGALEAFHEICNAIEVFSPVTASQMRAKAAGRPPTPPTPPNTNRN